MSSKGVNTISLRIPEQWSAAWFSRFIRDVLAKADTRNQIAGAGISITSSSSDEPPTLSASDDLQNLLNQSYVLVTPSGFLPQERILAGESGVISITDGGADADIVVGIENNGINISKIQELVPLSVIGNPFDDDYSSVQIFGSAQYDVLHVEDVAGDLTVAFSAIDHNYISDFNEAAQDAVGAILVDSTTIDFTYSDSTPSITADVNVGFNYVWTNVHTWSLAEPRLIFNETDAGTNLKLWDIDVNSSVMKIRSRTDADGAGSDFLSLVRGATTTFDSMRVGATGLTLGTNDANILYANNGEATFDAHALDTNARFRLRRYNGSMTGSPTEILNNNVIGQHIFQAYSSSAAVVRSPVVFQATATENWSVGATGTKWTVTTTANGASSASLSLTLQGNQLQSEDGIVTLPAWTFRNDLDSGRYRIGANNIGDAVNGAKVLDISTTGLGVTGTLVASGAISGSNLSSSGGANPSVSIGLTAVNGSAITFMRSDAAPALDQSIAPTWSDLHIFSRASSSQLNRFNSDAANGPFVSFSRSGTTKADIGNAAAIVNSGTVDDLAINTRATTSGAIVLAPKEDIRVKITAAGETLISDGSVSLPGMSWLLDTNSGRYRIGADNMGDAVGGSLIVDYSAARVSFQIPVRLKGYTVATLPAGVAGDTAYVTDALAPVFLGAVAGGGAVTCTVFYNGANWVVQ
jgi:hypothetical protein